MDIVVKQFTFALSYLDELLVIEGDVCLVSSQNGHTVCTSCLTHQKYCSFINYALNRYQAPSCNSGLDPSFISVKVYCVVNMFKIFSCFIKLFGF